jgi:hypothetical protein
MKHPTTTLVVLLAAWPFTARAEFAEPPPGSYPAQPPVDQDHSAIVVGDSDSDVSASLIRVHAGPALRIHRDGVRLGAWAAADIGKSATGLRVTGAWIDVGARSGLAQYTAELWIDLGQTPRLRPTVGVGAGLGRLPTATSDGEEGTATVGLGILRAGLQLLLPVRDTDARASLEAVGSLPVARPRELEPATPWALVIASVGVGF